MPPEWLRIVRDAYAGATDQRHACRWPSQIPRRQAFSLELDDWTGWRFSTNSLCIADYASTELVYLDTDGSARLAAIAAGAGFACLADPPGGAA